MLEFRFKSFKASFADPITEWVHIWYDETYWLKILRTTIPTH